MYIPLYILMPGSGKCTISDAYLYEIKLDGRYTKQIKYKIFKRFYYRLVKRVAGKKIEGISGTLDGFEHKYISGAMKLMIDFFGKNINQTIKN